MTNKQINQLTDLANHLGMVNHLVNCAKRAKALQRETSLDFILGTDGLELISDNLESVIAHMRALSEDLGGE